MNALLTSLLPMLFKWLIERSKEPSSNSAYAVAAQFIQYYIPDAWTWLPPVLDGLTALCLALAVGLREKAKPVTPVPVQS